MNADALVEEGTDLYRKGDLEAAIRRYQSAVASEPRHARAHYNLGVVLQGLGRVDEAIAHYAQVPAGTPEFPKALVNWGNALKDRDELRDAGELYARAIAADPADHGALKNLTRLGDIALQRRDLETARELYARAVGFGSADGCAGLGTVAGELGDLHRALGHFADALSIEPRHASAHYNLGVALQRLDRLPEAIEHFARAVEIVPAHGAALVSWGESLRRLGDVEGAAALFRRVLEIDPGHAFALNNLATVALDRGEIEEAHALFTRLVAMQPEFEEPRFNLGIIALHRQEFARGWQEYERRFQVFRSGRSLAREGLRPFELRDAGEVRRLAVAREQGIGDQILFTTLLPELVSRGIRAVIEVDRRLVAAYARSLPDLEFVSPEESAEAFERCDALLPMGSLPRLFRPTRESFVRQPRALLRADPGRVRDFAQPSSDRRRVAISWRSFQSGSRAHVEGRKSIPLERFAVLAGAGVALVDVQYGDVQAEREAFDAAHPGVRRQVEGLDPFDDLEGVLAVLESSDLVVTASNVTAHLAGAIGKRTWLVFLGANPVFHYWVPGPDRRSLWYPSVEIVTDRSWTTWEQAFEAVAARWAALSPTLSQGGGGAQ